MKQIFTLIVLCFTLISNSGAATPTSTSTNNPEFAKGPIKNLFGWLKAGPSITAKVVPSSQIINVEGTGAIKVKMSGYNSSPVAIDIYIIKNGTDTIAQQVKNILSTGTFSDSVSFTNLNSSNFYKASVKFRNNSAQSDAAFTITYQSIAPFSLDIGSINPACWSENNGNFVVTPNPSTTTIASYVLTNSLGTVVKPSFTDPNVTGLAPDSYILSATDNLGRSTTTNIKILENPKIVFNTTIPVDAKGCNNGSITLKANGGNGGNLTYTLTNSVGVKETDIITSQSSTAQFQNLAPETYTATATDGVSCSVVSNPITVNQTVTPVLSGSFSQTATILCNADSTGAITINAAGGTPNYIYRLYKSGVLYKTSAATAATSYVVNKLVAGSYSYTITDNNGCVYPTALTPLTISQPKALFISSFTKKDVNQCIGANNGSISVTALGGTSASTNYTYTLTGQPNQIAKSATFNSLAKNTYTLRILDDNLCHHDTIVSIKDPVGTPLTVSVDTTYISCNGKLPSDGTAKLQGAGGNISHTPANEYKYAYTPQGNIPTSYSATFSTLPYTTPGLAAGNYAAWVQDANGCTDSTNFTIAAFKPLTVTLTATPVAGCNGESKGTITAKGKGGYGDIDSKYYYKLTPGTNTTGDATGAYTGLPAGKYTVTVSDNKKCTNADTISVTQPKAIVIGTPTVTPTQCHGTATGTIAVTATGGAISPLLYSLKNISSPATYAYNTVTKRFENIPTGTYIISVTDNLCTKTDTVTVTDAPILKANITAITNVKCFNGNTGEISVSATGGAPGYTYDITPKPSGYNYALNKFSGLIANTTTGYTITVTDAKGCTDDTTGIKITQPATGVSFKTIAITNVSTCPGDANGSISVTSQGGTAPYTVSLNHGNGSKTGNPVTFSALKAYNDYTFHLVDAANCSPKDSVVALTEPNPIVVDTVQGAVISPKCINGTNGSIQVTAKQNSNPVAGTFTIINSKGVSPVASQTTTGTATFTNLAADIYKVAFSSTANSCKDTLYNITLKNPNQLVIDSVRTINPTCQGTSNGQIKAYAHGGTGSITYKLGATTQTNNGIFLGLKANQPYTLTITDANNCSTVPASQSYTLTEPQALVVVSATANNILCASAPASGSIKVQVGGGTAPYKFDLKQGATIISTNDSGVFVNLAKNTYTVTVNDKYNCSPITTANLTVGDPTIAFDFAYAAKQANCFGNGNELHLTTNVVSSSLEYSYNNGTSWNSQKDSVGMADGTYTMLMRTKDKLCVTPSQTKIFATNPKVVVNPVPNNITGCYGDKTGSISVSATGGNGTYKYALQDTISSPFKTLTAPQQFSPLSSGVYKVWAKDGLGCIDTLSVKINQPTKLVATYTVQQIDATHPTGTITITNTTGGTTARTFAVYPVATTPTTYNNILPTAYPNLAAGFYVIEVKNASCVEQDTVQIYNSLNVTVTSTPATCKSGKDGSVSLTPVDGLPNYTYTLTQGSTIFAPINKTDKSTTTFTGVSEGTCTVTVTDKDGKFFTSIVTITAPDSVKIETYTTTAVACDGTPGTITITKTSGGDNNYTYFRNGTQNQNTVKNIFTNIPSGISKISVVDGKGCLSDTTVITINPASTITLTHNTVKEDYGSNDGSFISVANGGTAVNYDFELNNTGTWKSSSNNTQSFTGLAAGVYIVKARNQSCTSLVADTVIIPYKYNSLTAKVSSTGNKCFGDANASISISVTDATTKIPYSITITGKKLVTPISATVYRNDTTFSSLTEDDYSISIKDNSSPKKSYTSGISIKDNTKVSFATFIAINPTCHADTIGSIVAIAQGGYNALDYRYVISSSPTDTLGSGSFANLKANNSYTVTAIDGLGCKATRDTTITSPEKIIVNAVGNNSTKTITATVTSPVGTYNYRIAPGAAAFTPVNTFTGLTADVPYTVYAQNSKLCIDSSNVVILKNAGPVDIVVDSVCGSDKTGTAIVTINVGKPSYSYLLEHSLTKNGPYTPYRPKSYMGKTITFTNLDSGYYRITMNSSDVPSIFIADTFYIHSKKILINPETDGDNMRIIVHASGGSKLYTYSINGPSGSFTQVNDSIFNALKKGTYDITVTDAKGCSGASSVVLNPTKLKVIVLADTVCKGNKGNAAFSITSGEAPYIFKVAYGKDTIVNTILYRTDTLLTNLNSGVYHYFVRDNKNDFERADSFAIVETRIKIDTTFDSKTMTLTIHASGGKAPYQFALNNISNTNPYDSIFTNVKMQTYDVHVWDARGCDSTISINLRGHLSVRYDLIKDTICKKGLDGDVKITAFGKPDYKLTFTYENDPPVTDIPFTDNIEFQNFIEGKYVFHVEDADGRSNDTIINIYATNIKINPELNPETKTITVHASEGVAPYTFGLNSWTIAPTSGNPKDSIFTNLALGTYTINVKDFNGCEDSLDVELAKPRIPVDVTVVTDTICLYGDNGEFIVKPTGGVAPYTLSVTNESGSPANATYTPVFNVSDTVKNVPVGKYFIHIDDSNGSVYDTTINIVAIIPQVQFTPVDDSSKYEVGCGNDPSGKIMVIVSGGRKSQTGLYSYFWDYDNEIKTAKDTIVLDKIPANDYTLFVSDTICEYRHVTTITSQYPSVKIVKDVNNSDTATCNTPGTLALRITGGAQKPTAPFYSIDWYEITGKTGNDYIITALPDYKDLDIATNIKAGGYLVKVTDLNCSVFSDSLSVPQNNNMKVDIKAYLNGTPFTLMGSDTVCYADTVALKIQAKVGDSNLDPTTYTWLWNSLDIPKIVYQSNTSDSLSVISTDRVPSYRLFAKYSDICKVDTTIGIKVRPYPVVILTPEVSIGKGDSYTFTPQIITSSTDDDFVYYWYPSFNMLDNDTILTPTFTFKESADQLTTYPFTFRLSYGKKQAGIAQCALNVNTVLKLAGGVDPQDKNLGSNTLTPNDDGFNDFWYIKNAEHYPNINVEVFNRWGQKVYSGTGYDNSSKVWRGNYNGARLPSGVYYYVIKLNSKATALTGTVTIIR